jgi:hypothetical protein
MRLFFTVLAAAFFARTLSAQVTYSREVSRVIQEKCQSCHREGDIAPFPLATFEDAKTWAADIKRVVEEGIMPPWKPVDAHDRFTVFRGLTGEQRRTILEWVEAGAPEGDRADLPEPLPGRGKWVLGEPDLTLTMPERYTAPRGKDMYRCFVLPTGLSEDRFVSAVDVVPGDRSIVHHVILYLDTTGQSEKLDAAEPGPGYTCYGGPGIDVGAAGGATLSISDLLSAGNMLGGYTPGQRAEHLPEGVGLFLDRRARVVMQVHYYSTRNTAEDQTEVGIYYSRKPVERRLLWAPVVPLDSRGRLTMTIPAGAENHTVTAQFSLPPLSLFDVSAVAVYPHMHLLGRKIEVEVKRPRDSAAESMIRIDEWDFNWQGPYEYKEPVKIPGGSTVKLSCTYDNSANNPKNPSPEPKTITWGEGTEDEMCVAFLGITFDREDLLPLTSRQAGGRRR